MMPTRSRHASRSGSFDFNISYFFSNCLMTHAGDVEGAVLFDVKEEGESDVALSHLLTKENVRRINHRRQLAHLLLSFCSTFPFVVFLYRYLYFYFIILLFLFLPFLVSILSFCI